MRIEKKLEEVLLHADKEWFDLLRKKPGMPMTPLRRVQAMLVLDETRGYYSAQDITGMDHSNIRKIHKDYREKGRCGVYGKRGLEIVLRLEDEIRCQPEFPEFKTAENTPEKVEKILEKKPVPQELSTPVGIWDYAGFFCSENIRVAVTMYRNIPKNTPIVIKDLGKESKFEVEMLPDTKLPTEVQALGEYMKKLDNTFSENHHMRIFLWKNFETPLPEEIMQVPDTYENRNLEIWRQKLTNSLQALSDEVPSKKVAEMFASFVHNGGGYALTWVGRPLGITILPPQERLDNEERK